MRWVPLLVLLLAACAPGFNRAPDPHPAPRSVRVLAVAGPALPMGRLLARSVADALARRNIPAGPSDGPSGGLSGAAGYVLEGRTEVNLKTPGSPYIVFIHWTLRDRGGASVGTYSQGVRGTWLQWEYGDPRIIRAVGDGTAEAVWSLLSQR